jgi:hypothetical protein
MQGYVQCKVNSDVICAFKKFTFIGGRAQVLEHLPIKLKAPSSNPSTTRKKMGKSYILSLRMGELKD